MIFTMIRKDNMLVDTNILIYAINSDSPKHIKAQEFLKEHVNSLKITHQNILESIRVLTHQKFPKPMRIKDALSAVTAISEALQVILPNQSSFYLAVELIKEYKLTGNRIFDAYLAATALTNVIDTIATDNTIDFQKFSGLKVVNPFFQ